MSRARTISRQAAVIDGAVIGGVTPAAGSFTTLGASGNATLAGTTLLTGPVSLGGSPGVAGQLLRSAGAGVPPAWGDGGLVRGVSQSASGTAVDFTGIPSWARRVMVGIAGLSTSGTSNLLLRLGSGSFATSGYSSGVWSNNTLDATSTAGILLAANTTSAMSFHGLFPIFNLTGNVWACSSALVQSAAGVSNGHVGGGSITLAGVLDRIRITTLNGTDTFDAGTINIMWD